MQIKVTWSSANLLVRQLQNAQPLNTDAEDRQNTPFIHHDDRMTETTYRELCLVRLKTACQRLSDGDILWGKTNFPQGNNNDKETVVGTNGENGFWTGCNDDTLD